MDMDEMEEMDAYIMGMRDTIAQLDDWLAENARDASSNTTKTNYLTAQMCVRIWSLKQPMLDAVFTNKDRRVV